MSHVLVINAGSSSLKYRLIDAVPEETIAGGLVERIGAAGSRLVHHTHDDIVARITEVPDHEAAVRLVIDQLRETERDPEQLAAVGHRVVHGGADYQQPVLYDAAVDATIERLSPLAPLHNPPSLAGLRVMARLLPDVPHVVVFDTAFHATMPPEAYTYALPRDLAQRHRVRRYGFHGTSYSYVVRTAAELLGIPRDDINLIVGHLGNGASMAAVRGGRSIDTTMGLTPLAGLMMGTRCGDIDPGIIFHLARTAGMSVEEIDEMLTRRSGLKGLAGEPDMREVRALARSGDRAARLALDVYAYRIRAYVGSYYALLPGLHGLVLSAGIGENDAELRAEICAPLQHLGIRLDPARNDAPDDQPRLIDDGSGPVRVLVVPTNEEVEIARQAAALAARATR